MDGRGSAALERRYRRWLRLYPRGYRGERGEEILQTLLELSRPGQSRPAPREVTAVALQGLRMRAGAAEGMAARRLWLAALPLAACLLLVVRVVRVLLVLSAMLAYDSTRTAANLAMGVWPAVPAVLVLVAVRRRAYRLAVVLAVTPVIVDVLLMIQAGMAGKFAAVPGNPIVLALLYLADDLLPAVLLLPLARSGGAPAPRRWQLGVPVALAGPLVGVVAAQPWPSDPADDGVLRNGIPVLLVLALVGVLLWGALVDGCVALALSLCLLADQAVRLGGAGALAMPVPWGDLVVIVGAGAVLACAGAYRAHRQAIG